MEQPGFWPPPPALPAAEFQHPFRCYGCGHWLRDSKCLFKHASNRKLCNNLAVDIRRRRQDRTPLSELARDHLANVAQFCTLSMFPLGYPVRCPHCRHFFVNHLCLSEHVFLEYADPKEHDVLEDYPTPRDPVPISMGGLCSEPDVRWQPEFSNKCACGGVQYWLFREKWKRRGNILWRSTVIFAKSTAYFPLSLKTPKEVTNQRTALVGTPGAEPWYVHDL